MKARAEDLAVYVLLIVVSSGCAVPFIDTSEEAAARVREQDLGTLPYHPVAYHLDLSIFAYQLYTQTLVWPFDPYYEEAKGERDALIGRVRDWVREVAPAQVAAGGSLEDYRGPGALGGFADNVEHDPLIFQYSRLHPWSSAVTYPLDEWIEYLTPREITQQIDQVWMCVRTTGVTQQDNENLAEGAVTLYPVPVRRDDAANGARDVLVAFEGGTGDKGEPNRSASQSLVGYALLRATEGDAYDVHIAFRGSRSGSGFRALVDALSSEMASGNPDWITDLGYREEVRPAVSPLDGHMVSRGMATGIASTLPQVLSCLDQVAGRERAEPPAHIYVTGHSLGGALAQVFTSAVLLGDRFGPEGDRMPASLRAWPWERMKLITFAAPRVGNRAWAEHLTTERLESQFYKDQLAPFDGAAVGITDLEILPRLIDPDRPAAYRVLIPSDPITSDLIPGGAHVGHTVYLEEGDTLEILAHKDLAAHEPINMRALITDTLRDSRVPAEAWAYHEMEVLNPARDGSKAGTISEYEKLIAAVRDYYASRDLFFDVQAYDASASIFLGLVAR